MSEARNFIQKASKSLRAKPYMYAEKDGGTSTKNDRVHVGNFHFVL